MFNSKQLLRAIGVNMGGNRTFAASCLSGREADFAVIAISRKTNAGSSASVKCVVEQFQIPLMALGDDCDVFVRILGSEIFPSAERVNLGFGHIDL